MDSWLAIVLLGLAILVVSFLGSGVLPRWLEARRALRRVEEFHESYDAYLSGDAGRHAWLAARLAEMQRDAEAVGMGTGFVAPPPTIGGGYMPYELFGDLFGRQTFANVVTPQHRLDALEAVIHEWRKKVSSARRDVWNPARWLHITFERIVGFPRYLLRTAGFSDRVANSNFSRVITVLWSLLVGAATIGAFLYPVFWAE